MMDGVYGDHVHQNDGTHLSGGIEDDKIWQDRMNQLIVLQPQQYDLPKGAVAHRFIEELDDLFKGVMERKWNGPDFHRSKIA